MNMRLLFALFSCMAAGCIGMRYSSRLKADAARLSGWIALLDRLHLSMRSAGTSLPDALTSAADADCAADALLRSLAVSLRRQPASTLLELYTARKDPDYPETPVICRLMESLDRGSLDNRLLAIGQAQEALRLLYESQVARVKRDAPMCTQLGWTAGACLMILLM